MNATSAASRGISPSTISRMPSGFPGGPVREHQHRRRRRLSNCQLVSIFTGSDGKVVSLFQKGDELDNPKNFTKKLKSEGLVSEVGAIELHVTLMGFPR